MKFLEYRNPEQRPRKKLGEVEGKHKKNPRFLRRKVGNVHWKTDV